MNFDPSDFEVLIGNPKHAYNEEYLQNRIVVKDEFSETEYESCFDDMDALVTGFVSSVSLPFSTYRDVLAARADLTNEELGRVVNWFDRYGLYRDKNGVLTGRGTSYHVLAPALTYALLHGHLGDLGNGWEWADLGFWANRRNLATHGINDRTFFVRNQETHEAYLLRPPEVEKANGFVGLDGTPTLRMWKLATGLDLDHREVLSNSEKQRYISKVLNHTIIQTNNSKKPYQNARNVTPPKDTELAFWIQLREGQYPSVITSKKALEKEYTSYQNGEFFDYVDRVMNFAQVRSSNDFGNEHLGLVTGSRHYGDEYIKRWGAYLGEGITPTVTTVQQWSRTYGAVGNAIHDHLHHQTLQDVLRFGRNQQPTTVYVNTSALPSWVPTKTNLNFPRFGKNRRDVIQVLKKKGSAGASVAELADETDLSKDGARKAGEYLVQQRLAEICELQGYSNVFCWNDPD